jgi:hypothetical protein
MRCSKLHPPTCSSPGCGGVLLPETYGSGRRLRLPLDELAGDGKAKPCPAVAARGQGIGLGEILKQFGLLFGCHADASIHDSNRPVSTRSGRAPHEEAHMWGLFCWRGRVDP